MKSEEYALMLMEDKSLSNVDIINLSGMLNDIPEEDIPCVIHAISILKKADKRFLEKLAKEI